MIESQIDAHDLIVFDNNRFRYIDHNMQPPFALAQDQVCRGNLVPRVTSTVLRDAEREAHLALRRGQANGLCLPIQGGGFLVVAYGTTLADRTLNRLEYRLWSALFERLCHFLGIRPFVLQFPGKGTLQGLRRFDAGLNE